MKKLRLLVFIIAVFAAFRLDAAEMTDDAGTRHSFDSPPARVVSLLPSVTEVICYIGASDALAGITYHDTNFEGTAGKTVVGGAFTPQYEIINELKPDLLITSPRDFERTKAGRAENSYPILVIDDGVSLAESEKRILMLGEIFGRQDEAKRVIEGNRAFMETIRLKVDKIPNERRKKVILLYMGADGPLTPGRGSFQRELIEAAGGITGDFGDGPAVPITLEQWREFAPDYVFTVPSDHAELKEFLNGDGWRDVPAVRDGRVSSFPDALVCRASAHTGYFVAWLSSDIYADEFADAANLVHPQEVIGEREISVDIPYVESVRIVESRIMDFVHRTLLVDFKRPQHIVSTNYGERGGVETVGNSYSPTPTWSIYHKLGFERSQEDLLSILKLDGKVADLMLTGADMNNAVVKTASYRDMTVTAIVTGGVEGNAIRTSKDTGNWYEPGTINILVMANHKLSEMAATRAIVTITEAKTAALWDMDIRSVQNRAKYPATGTGTDTVIVVSGEGTVLNWSGGHSKMGELIADAVYRGVQEALLKQNGKARIRNVLERLEERGIYVNKFADYQRDMEELMLSPKYKYARGFLESAFSLSDAQVMGQLSDTEQFKVWALTVAGNIAGRPVERIEDILDCGDVPPILDIALNALATGISRRNNP